MTRAGRKAEAAGRGTVPSTSSTRVGFASPPEPPHPEDHALTARGSAGGPPDSRSRFSRSSAYSSSLTGRTLSAIVSRNQSSRSRMTAPDDSFSGGFCSSSRRASSSFQKRSRAPISRMQHELMLTPGRQMISCCGMPAAFLYEKVTTGIRRHRCVPGSRSCSIACRHRVGRYPLGTRLRRLHVTNIAGLVVSQCCIDSARRRVVTIHQRKS